MGRQSGLTGDEAYAILHNKNGGGSGQNTNYNDLINKPTINEVEVSGDKLPEDYGIQELSKRKEMMSTDTSVILQPNVLYVFPEMETLEIALATPGNQNIVNEYHFFFYSGNNETNLILNDIISDAYSIEPNMKYEVSILENVAYIKGVPIND